MATFILLLELVHGGDKFFLEERFSVTLAARDVVLAVTHDACLVLDERVDVVQLPIELQGLSACFDLKGGGGEEKREKIERRGGKGEN